MKRRNGLLSFVTHRGILPLIRFVIRFIVTHGRIKRFFPAWISSLHKILSGPGSIYLGITDRCNFSCLFCPPHANLPGKPAPPAASGAVMPLSQCRELIEDAARIGTRDVLLQGFGEPFLHPEIVPIISCIKQKGLTLNIATNGSVLTEPVMRTLVEHQVNMLAVSIYSPSAQTHGVICGTSPQADIPRKILTALDFLARFKKERGSTLPLVCMTVVMSRLNMSEARQIVDFSIAAHAYRLLFYRLYFCEGLREHFRQVVLTAEDFAALEKELILADRTASRHRLQTNIHQFIRIYREEFARHSAEFRVTEERMYQCCVLPDGTIYPYEVPEPMGNLNKRSFPSAWYSYRYLTYRLKLLRLARRKEMIPTHVFCQRCYKEPAYRNDCLFRFM